MIKNKTMKLIAYQSFEKEFEKSHTSLLNKSKKKINTGIVKDINNFYNNKKYSPQNDFYDWVNNEWLDTFKISKGDNYIVEYDDFRLVQQKVYLELFGILKDYLKTNKHTTFGKCLNTFYGSFHNLSSVEQLKTNSLKIVNELDTLRKDKQNLWKVLAMFNNSELYSWGAPFSFNMLPDQKEPTIYRATLNGPQMSLIDIEVYFEDGTEVKYKQEFKRQYLKHIRDLFDTIFGKNHDLKAEDVFNTEVKMLASYGCLTEKEDPQNYNKITKEECMKKYKFDWETFCKELGFKKVPNWFITRNVNYLKCGTELLLKEWDTKEFRTYFIFNYIRQTSIFCKKTRDIVFNFRGKFERGEKRNFDDEGINGIYGLGLAFNKFLSNEYIKKYENKRNIDYLINLAQDLKAVYIRIIKRNNWLNNKTKQNALLKLNHLELIIGSPPVIHDDPILPYTSNCVENMLMICDWRFKKSITLEGTSTQKFELPSIDWHQYPPKFTGSQSYIVNAAYTPTKNSIYVPLGYIQEPFIDLKERGLEYNLAHIGWTLGHEMSHSLDNWGSQYDYKGRLHDWWTKEDKAMFKKKGNDVIKQYKEFAKRDKISYEVEMTLGEDLADISSLAICTEYLRDFHIYNNAIIPIRNLSYRQLFIYYAYQMRQKIYRKSILSNLKTNPHPLDKYRTNIPLSRSYIFRSIFKVKKTDKMYWNNMDTIW